LLPGRRTMTGRSVATGRSAANSVRVSIVMVRSLSALSSDAIQPSKRRATGESPDAPSPNQPGAKCAERVERAGAKRGRHRCGAQSRKEGWTIAQTALPKRRREPPEGHAAEDAPKMSWRELGEFADAGNAPYTCIPNATRRSRTGRTTAW